MKKIISLLLCLVMVFGLGITAFAAEPSYETITGEYKYLAALHMLGDGDPTYRFTYSDKYFTHSGYEYDHELAIMTMDMVQSAAVTSEGDWSVANKNFYDLMGKCGFKNIDQNYYAVHRPTADSIGVSMASKKIVDDGRAYTLLAVGVRGHGYCGEWGSNVKIGKSGDAQGFAHARDQVLDYIKEYVAKYHVTGSVKVWLTGYSRSAITANLVGGALDQGFSLGKGVSFNLADLYCYTFEAPQGTANTACRDKLYGNIHNIINANDLVTLVSFTKWGHSRFGIDYYLPCRQNDGDYYYSLKPKADALIGEMDKMNVAGVALDTIDDFHYISLNPLTAAEKQNVTQIEFYPEAIDALLEALAPTREYYVDHVQADLSELLTTLFTVEDGMVADALEIFAQKFTATENLQKLLSSMTISGTLSEGPAVDLVVDMLMQSLQEAGCAGYNGDQVRALLMNLVPKLLVMFEKHPDTVITLLLNIAQILNAHCPEIGRAWLEVTPAEFFEAQNPNTFSDIAKEHYCYDAAKWAFINGIATGYSSSVFAPDNACTRAQVVTFLWRANGSPEPKGNCPFADVSKSAYYSKAVTWAAEKGITLGVDKTHFKPDVSVSRAEFVTFLWRNDGQPRLSAKCPFGDVSSSAFYYNAVVWAAKSGITLGVDSTHFAPDNACTRGQVVTFLYRDMA